MCSDKVFCETLDCHRGGQIGCITLNSPKTLNAISLEMVDAIYHQLRLWQEKQNIACIVIKGSGDKAFCAGGDIQSMYHAMQKNPGAPCPHTEAFFSHEYRLDYTIHSYPKPVLVWGNGIVMGGGLGIFAAGSQRIVTETSRVAMPEITIALYPDVGASYFLNNMPEFCGRFLALTGASINSADCLYLGLADRFIEHKLQSKILSTLCEQSWSKDKDENTNTVDHVLSKFATESTPKLPVSNIEGHIEIINTIFQERDIHRLIDKFLSFQTEDSWLKKAQQTLQAGSPLHALIIDKQIQDSKGKSLADVFRSELILSTNIVRFSEFSEGIRALLIDKDNSPNWHYKNHHDVPAEFVDSFFAAPWPHNPLADL